jgi:hypothetical protein
VGDACDVSVPYTVNAVLSWSKPVQREDGEALAESDIASYDITYTDADGTLQSAEVAGDSTTWNIVLGEGNYDFAISVTDVYGLESALSATITCNISEASSTCN